MLLQSTDFTCGPAALLKAFAKASPAQIISRQEEFDIWNEANTAHMGYGPAGCLLGLAGAAQKRGFAATVCSGDIACIETALAEGLVTSAHSKAFNRRARQHRAQMQEQGIDYSREDLTLPLFENMFLHGRQPILLMRAPDECEHWVSVDRIESGRIVIDDPYPDYRRDYLRAIGSETPAFTIDELKQKCLFGGNAPTHLMLAIAARPH